MNNVHDFGKDADYIRREDAIEVADAVWSVTGDANVAKVWDQIKDLPSVKLATNLQPTCNQLATDCISRAAAIDEIEATIKANRSVHYEMRYWEDGMNCAKNIVEDLPSAQPLILTCDGCRHVGTYDTDFPCSGCIRREKDYYEQER